MNKLILGDSKIELQGIPDKSVDLVIIDPPYKFDTHGDGGAFGSSERGYYSEIEGLGKLDAVDGRIRLRQVLETTLNGYDTSVLADIIRVMKKINMYVWCSKAQLLALLQFAENNKCNFDLLTWHKTNPIPTCNNTYLCDTEYLVFIRERGVRVYGNYATKRKWYATATNQRDKELYKHPTIKPLEIVKNLVINSSKAGDTVLDCFMGSGTTGVACKELGRDFIGIELNKEYFDIARKRIDES